MTAEEPVHLSPSGRLMSQAEWEGWVSMTDQPNRAPTADERYFGKTVTARGFPVVNDATDPCWSLFCADWPGLTAEEAQEIYRKTHAQE